MQIEKIDHNDGNYRRKTNKLVLCQSVNNHKERVREVGEDGREKWRELGNDSWIERDTQQYEWFDKQRPKEVSFIDYHSPIYNSNETLEVDHKVKEILGNDQDFVLTSRKVQSSPLVRWSGVDAITTSDKGQKCDKVTSREGSKQVHVEEAVWMVSDKSNPFNHTYPAVTHEYTLESSKNTSSPRQTKLRVRGDPNRKIVLKNDIQSCSNTNPKSPIIIRRETTCKSQNPINTFQTTFQLPVMDEVGERKDYRRCLNRNLKCVSRKL